MNTAQLLADLRAQDIKITATAGKLKINAPKGALTPGLETQLRLHKQELLELLAAPQLPGLAPAPSAPPITHHIPDTHDHAPAEEKPTVENIYISSDATEPTCSKGYVELWANTMLMGAISLGGLAVGAEGK